MESIWINAPDKRHRCKRFRPSCIIIRPLSFQLCGIMIASYLSRILGVSKFGSGSDQWSETNLRSVVTRQRGICPGPFFHIHGAYGMLRWPRRFLSPASSINLQKYPLLHAAMAAQTTLSLSLSLFMVAATQPPPPPPSRYTSSLTSSHVAPSLPGTGARSLARSSTIHFRSPDPYLPSFSSLFVILVRNARFT